MEKAPALIDIRNATVFRDDTKVFDRLTLTVEQHRRTAIIGPNGAGKSTLIKLLSRELYPIVAPDSYVRILGESRPILWKLRRQIGLISQDLHNHYLGHVNALDAVISGFHGSVGVYPHQKISRQQRQQARDTMGELGIADLSGRRFDRLSTGQQRRVLLARALIHRPKHLVLDEPTSGLDLPATFKYLELIRGFMQAGGTVLLVTHHIHEIPPEIERVVLMSECRVVADGAREELLTSEALSDLYGMPLKLLEHNGYCQVLPA